MISILIFLILLQVSHVRKSPKKYTCLYDIFCVNCIHISAFWDFSYRQLLRSALSCCWGFGMIVEHSVAQNTEKHRTILSTSVTNLHFLHHNDNEMMWFDNSLIWFDDLMIDDKSDT